MTNINEEKNKEVKEFLKEKVVIDFNATLNKSDLYVEYVKWCNTKMVWRLSIIQFSRYINYNYDKITPKSARDSKTKKRIWKNIKLIN